jgi:hypothetical protein
MGRGSASTVHLGGVRAAIVHLSRSSLTTSLSTADKEAWSKASAGANLKRAAGGRLETPSPTGTSVANCLGSINSRDNIWAWSIC